MGAWVLTGQPDVIRATFATLAVLVMGYPCALGMATPLAMIRRGGEAAQRGILMRTGEAFQVFKDVQQVILDKTGTVTLGKPQVAAIVPLDEHDPQAVLRLAASGEQLSEHPVARAVVKYSEEKGLKLTEAREFQAVPGLGIRAKVAGTRILVGCLRFLQQEGVDVSAAQEKTARLEAEAKTVIGVAESGRLIGLLTIADQIKPDAVEAVKGMEAAGLTPVMLTGDNEETAKTVASLVGIEAVHAQVLPGEKAARVRELQQKGFRVAMVGDGINDAPALMQADVGVATGAGTDIAIESSDVILLGERLGGFVDAYHIAKKSVRKTVQNLSLAFSFNGIGVPLAVTGLVHPVWAMIAMVASVSTVLLNSFTGRLLPGAIGKGVSESSGTKGPVERLEFDVPSIHCEGCVQNIRDALSRFPEVAGVEGEPKRKRITVTVQEGLLLRDRVAGEIARLGHVVE
jgi:heavy metal translocating P-type ATPase